MRICRICGEEKEDKEFYRFPYFPLSNRNTVWCRTCMRMYLHMKKQEEMARLVTAKTTHFCLKFD